MSPSYELANNIKRFKGFKDKIQRQPVQSFWAFTIEMGLGVHARDKDKIKSWGDLAGKTRLYRTASMGHPRPGRTRT